MNHPRLIGLALALLGLAILAASAASMAARIRRFNTDSDFPLYHFERLLVRSGTLFDHPVALHDDRFPADDPQFPAHAALRVDYAGSSHLVPTRSPPTPDFPTLGLYDEWAALLLIKRMRTPAEAHALATAEPGSPGLSAPPPASSTSAQLVEDLADRRAVLISRLTPPGYDEETWGKVRRDEWTFLILELQPDGSATPSRLRFPPSKRTARALQKEIDDNPQHPLRGIPVIQERSWQYQAALHVIPKLQVPKYKFENTALSFKTLGWTLPAACLSGLVICAGLCILFAPQRTRSSTTPR